MASLDRDKPGTKEPASIGLSDSASNPRGLPKFETRRKLLIALIPTVIVACMVLLGWQLNSAMREQAFVEYAHTDVHYAQDILAPVLGTMEAPLDSAELELIDGILAAPPFNRATRAAKVWDTDGTIIYSTDRAQIGVVVLSPEVLRALAGNETVQFDDIADADGLMNDHGDPLIEVYVPVRVGSDITYIAEFYHDGADLRARLRETAFWIWSIIAVVTGLMLMLLLFIGWRDQIVIRDQQQELRHRLVTAQRLLLRNQRLKHEAETSRSNTIRNNQQFLSTLGSHLHDGPVQLLTLLVLQLTAGEQKKSGTASQTPSPGDLAQTVLADLRGLAHGLVLPELDELDSHATIQLAAERHSAFTGSKVEVAIDEDFPREIDAAVRICLYRVIQEGLNNAFKHAGGAGQVVEAHLDDERLIVSIIDAGNPNGSRPPMQKGGLGLIGLRRQVRAVSGAIDVFETEAGGMRVSASLPISLKTGDGPGTIA